MARRKLKPIEERCEYSSMVLNSFDEIKSPSKIIFINTGHKIEARRRCDYVCICLLTEDLDGEYGIHMQTSKIHPEELIEIANYLSNLNRDTGIT